MNGACLRKSSLEPDEEIQVGIYGDSISHGRGTHVLQPFRLCLQLQLVYIGTHRESFGKGDTSQMMVDRFEKDVLPFHLKTLLIMGGTNSLRTGHLRRK